MLTTITAAADPASDRHPLTLRPTRSLADRDEYGPITGRPGGLFTTTVPLALESRDEMGRRVAAWVPDGDLL